MAYRPWPGGANMAYRPRPEGPYWLKATAEGSIWPGGQYGLKAMARYGRYGLAANMAVWPMAVGQ